ncbi:MAG: hypothetical protein CV087_22885 [Candidatus Brocadia sp. WS118]|nr:MAG: hypothetical protein CV087_22885 [Candidatus Brocadia sp. WS118]
MMSVYQLIRRARLRIILPFGFLLLCFSSPCLAGVVYVAAGGSQLANGMPTSPVPSVKSGVCRAGSGDTIVIGGGVYNEELIIDKRVTLVASGGTATIVGNAGKRLKVLTYNTRLFGFMNDYHDLSFKDDKRAVKIADKISAEDADIVALQEVWDFNLSKKICEEIVKKRGANYYQMFWSEEMNEGTDVLGPGDNVQDIVHKNNVQDIVQ